MDSFDMVSNLAWNIVLHVSYAGMDLFDTVSNLTLLDFYVNVFPYVFRVVVV